MPVSCSGTGHQHTCRQWQSIAAKLNSCVSFLCIPHPHPVSICQHGTFASIDAINKRTSTHWTKYLWKSLCKLLPPTVEGLRKQYVLNTIPKGPSSQAMLTCGAEWFLGIRPYIEPTKSPSRTSISTLYSGTAYQQSPLSICRVLMPFSSLKKPSSPQKVPAGLSISQCPSDD